MESETRPLHDYKKAVRMLTRMLLKWEARADILFKK
jgi:hypothetical protein